MSGNFGTSAAGSVLSCRLRLQAWLFQEKLLHTGAEEVYSNLSKTSGVGVVPERTLQRHSHKYFKTYK